MLALPESETAILIQLSTESLPLLRARVRLLREAGWTLAQVGAPLGKNRSTTSMWQKSALDEHLEAAREKGPVPEAPRKEDASRVVNLFPDVPKSRRAELYELASKARKVRGWMAENDEARIAAAKLEVLLENYHELGVPYKRLAEYMGVTHRAVAARLERVAARKPHQITIAEAAA